MDETRYEPNPDSPARPSRSYLRVSDAERDAVVTELGEHFGQGRLDQAEFDDRMTRALAARTEGDLDGLLADLPRTGAAASLPEPRTWPRRPPIAVPLLFALILITTFAAGGGRHGWVPWPLWWLLPIMILRLTRRVTWTSVTRRD